jgi:hypothetical protein
LRKQWRITARKRTGWQEERPSEKVNRLPNVQTNKNKSRSVSVKLVAAIAIAWRVNNDRLLAVKSLDLRLQAPDLGFQRRDPLPMFEHRYNTLPLNARGAPGGEASDLVESCHRGISRERGKKCAVRPP